MQIIITRYMHPVFIISLQSWYLCTVMEASFMRVNSKATLQGFMETKSDQIHRKVGRLKDLNETC